jgi:hypothetical protein
LYTACDFPEPTDSTSDKATLGLLLSLLSTEEENFATWISGMHTSYKDKASLPQSWCQTDLRITNPVTSLIQYHKKQLMQRYHAKQLNGCKNNLVHCALQSLTGVKPSNNVFGEATGKEFHYWWFTLLE